MKLTVVQRRSWLSRLVWAVATAIVVVAMWPFSGRPQKERP